uniref:Uncharacterized protein n=1 Tax=Parascaris equorum TaxID=6256 RepID=A0A914REK8_PAREQ
MDSILDQCRALHNTSESQRKRSLLLFAPFVAFLIVECDTQMHILIRIFGDLDLNSFVPFRFVIMVKHQTVIRSLLLHSIGRHYLHTKLSKRKALKLILFAQKL